MNKLNKLNNVFDKSRCPNCKSIMTMLYPAKYICPKCRYETTGYTAKAKAPALKK